jgi:hypothetical protein
MELTFDDQTTKGNELDKSQTGIQNQAVNAIKIYEMGGCQGN